MTLARAFVHESFIKPDYQIYFYDIIHLSRRNCLPGLWVCQTWSNTICCKLVTVYCDYLEHYWNWKVCREGCAITDARISNLCVIPKYQIFVWYQNIKSLCDTKISICFNNTRFSNIIYMMLEYQIYFSEYQIFLWYQNIKSIHMIPKYQMYLYDTIIWNIFLLCQKIRYVSMIPEYRIYFYTTKITNISLW